jgi:hypothetical protein
MSRAEEVKYKKTSRQPAKLSPLLKTGGELKKVLPAYSLLLFIIYYLSASGGF